MNGYDPKIHGNRATYNGLQVIVLEWREAGLSKIYPLQSSEEEAYSVRTDNLKKPKFTIEENTALSVARVHWKSISYYTAGWIYGHNARFQISAPEGKQTDSAIEEMLAVGVDFEEITHGQNKAQGRSYSVVVNDFGSDLRIVLERETGVIATLYHDSMTGKMSFKQKYFILNFLGEELGFFSNKSFEQIFERIPIRFREVFLRGMHGEFFFRNDYAEVV